MQHTLHASDVATRHFAPVAPVAQAPRTPYHALGSDSAPRIPAWAEHRSVYRGSGRTLYLVETKNLDAAGNDLQRLSADGWDVRVERSADSARVALMAA
ncbi:MULTISPECIES: hypothetical protein [Leucobacter]|uniref:RES domain-containing protein n=1 Tax=Leucobacter iarius TaxID=333963 RepID=A0ABN2LC68_9MICO|nr:hypothetical protein [Leucobacter sp. Ag1]KKI16973.1 hypothetical protein XM48_12345 [Leucobacter sp. Ag1]